ncbi:protein-tyrosine-phosphatase [Linderina macrospora]|uniref:Protein-tyrosine-phosphatase n=1 Tax=Linderina macrospora TaxID=4868 RepID=A0ACC1JB02_9FUNG|nr:protein-tyrosine-phosphatase [Linderina macrospora]
MPDIIDPLIPPYRFGLVQPQLFRGGYPKKRNFRFLQRQQLKTILSLVPSHPDPHLEEFCETENIARITIPVASPNENVTVTDDIISQCLTLMTDPSKLPMYVHCLDGSNVTGVVLMCLRKLQLWRVASYQNEYLRFEQDGEIISEESEFVEAYTGKHLKLPNPYVSWLWPMARAPTDINALPFKDSVHPVMRHVTLAHRMSTDICQAEPLISLSRSVTDPIAYPDDEATEMAETKRLSRTLEMGNPPAELVSVLGLSNIESPRQSTGIADSGVLGVPQLERLKSPDKSDKDTKSEDGGSGSGKLHPSASTGALSSLGVAAEHTGKPHVPHDAAPVPKDSTVKGDSQQENMPADMPVVEETWKLVHKELRRRHAEYSSKHSSARDAKMVETAGEASPQTTCDPDHSPEQQPQTRREGESLSIGFGAAIVQPVEESDEDRDSVKEVALSFLVRALSLEGLGM